MVLWRFWVLIPIDMLYKSIYNLFLQLSISHKDFHAYKCIGANDKILDHFLSRNSDATIPFNLEPMGSPALFINTHALSSNLTTLPSGRWYFFAVRTTTACRISPRRTLCAALIETLPPGPDSGPKLRCFWTTTTMRSPRDGVLMKGRVYNGA